MSPQQGSIRTSRFAEIFGKTSSAIRQERLKNIDPLTFDEGEQEAKQRTYTGRDVLAYALFERLRAEGMSADDAAGAVRSCNADGEFLRRLEGGDDLRELFLLTWCEHREREVPFPMVMPFPEAAVAELSNHHARLAKLAENYGRKLHSGLGEDRLSYVLRGVTGIRLVHLLGLYQELRAKCRELGLALDGRHVFEIEKGTGE